MKTENNSGQPSLNMISEGTHIKGALETQSDIRVSGTVDGEINSKGKCIVTKSGYVKGNVNAPEADIAGTIEGEILVVERLILRQTAVVNGDISTKTLLVEEGASFEGACKMNSGSAGKKVNGKDAKEEKSPSDPAVTRV
ncbi:MAG: polymer-forming cytoskeletal protein [Balneolales bacterium]